MKLSTYAKKVGITYLTAYKYYRKGIIKGHQISTGTIFIDDTEIPTPIEEKKTISTRVILYARVSSSENKDNLITQLNRIREYSIAKGYTIVKEIGEIGSGLNAKRKKLLSILKERNFDIIIVEHKDRFARFGIEIIEELLSQTNRRIEIINKSDTPKEDIVQDFVSIITSYSAKIYGQRRAKRYTAGFIEELKKTDNN